jgi:hypothetical protein
MSFLLKSFCAVCRLTGTYECRHKTEVQGRTGTQFHVERNMHGPGHKTVLITVHCSLYFTLSNEGMNNKYLKEITDSNSLELLPQRGRKSVKL